MVSHTSAPTNGRVVERVAAAAAFAVALGGIMLSLLAAEYATMPQARFDVYVAGLGVVAVGLCAVAAVPRTVARIPLGVAATLAAMLAWSALRDHSGTNIVAFWLPLPLTACAMIAGYLLLERSDRG